MKHIYVLSLFVFSILYTTGNIFGQDSINPTVEVRREFDGKLLEISKSPLDTKYSDTLMKFNLQFDYSFFDRPYSDLYEFSPIESVNLNRKGVISYPLFYTKLLLSYPWSPEADVYIQPRTGDKFSILFYGNHNSFWGHSTGDVLSPVNRMINRGGLYGSYRWKKGELSFDGSYSNNNYGLLLNYADTISRTFENGCASVRVRSLDSSPTAFYYDVSLNYNHISDVYSLIEPDNLVKEDGIKADLLFGMTIARRHKVLLSLESNTVFDNKNNYEGCLGNFTITPQYKFENGRWRLNAGVSFSGIYGSFFSEEGKVANVYPNVYASFEAVRNSLWIYAKIDGENRLNTFNDILRINPYSSFSGLENYSVPIRSELGINGVAGDKFSYSLKGVYAHYDNYMNFYSHSAHQSIVQLNNVDEIYAKVELLFKSKSVTLGASFKYDYFFDSKVCMVPDFTVESFFKYNYRQRVFIDLNLLYYSSMITYADDDISYLPTLKVPGFVDLGAKITYSINSKFSVFAQGKNLLNHKIQYVHRYYEKGLNFGVGLFIKL